jgi:type I restriction enzyme S subunit
MAGRFPYKWQVLPLEDCMAAIIDYRGKTPRKTTSGIPLVTAKVVKAGRVEKPNEFIHPNEYDSWMRRGIPQAGDVVMTTEAPLGEIAQLDGTKVALAQRLITLRGKPHLLDNTFLKFLMQSEYVQDQLMSRSSGTTVLGIKQSELRKVSLFLPPLATQKAIAHILGTLDDKIELNRRMNETLESMARAIFKSWFVDFDPVRAKMDGRQPVGMDAETAALFPDCLEHSDGVLVPRGWSFTTLDSVLAVLETGSRPKGGVRGITSGVPSIGAESIIGLGHFDYVKTKFVPMEFYEAMRKGKVESWDVVLYKDGGRPGEYEPHVSMFGDGFPFRRCCINEHVYRMRTNEHATQALLYFWLTSDLLFDEMRRKGTGVAIPGLNSSNVRSLPALTLSHDILNAFDTRINSLISRIFSNCKENRSLATLRDTLLPKLLSGELRIPDAEKTIEEVI